MKELRGLPIVRASAYIKMIAAQVQVFNMERTSCTISHVNDHLRKTLDDMKTQIELDRFHGAARILHPKMDEIRDLADRFGIVDSPSEAVCTVLESLDLSGDNNTSFSLNDRSMLVVVHALVSPQNLPC